MNRFLLSIIFVFSLNICNAQSKYTLIPDPNFERELIFARVDTVLDGKVLTKNISWVWRLVLRSPDIYDLTGIQDFISLGELNCNNSKLTNLDLSKNVNLVSLSCGQNKLTNLNISNNPLLTTLYCYGNQLSTLDLSYNTQLGHINCSGNQLTSLDVSKNLKLGSLDCSVNKLTSLDLSKNSRLGALYCSENQLTSIQTYNNPDRYLLEALHCENNPNLKTACVFSVYYANKNKEYYKKDATTTWVDDCVNYNFTLIPDRKFEEKLIADGRDLDGLNGKVLTSAIANVSILNIEGLGIKDLTGIQDFKSLRGLYCQANLLKNIDVSKNISLDFLNCSQNQLTNLDISSNTLLRNLECSANQLVHLDVRQNLNLDVLRCYKNELTGFDFAKNSSLWSLNCQNNKLTSLDLSNNLRLQNLNCGHNPLTSLNLENNSYLTDLDLTKTSLSQLNTAKCDSLKVLVCDSSRFESLDLTKNLVLQFLSCTKNQLTNLEIGRSDHLEYVICSKNKLTTLDIRGNKYLREVKCDSNMLVDLKLDNTVSPFSLDCHENKLTKLDLSNNVKLHFLYCYSNQLDSINVSKCTDLVQFSCVDNKLQKLDISKNVLLTELSCYENQLSVLDVSLNPRLTFINCRHNKFTSLDVTTNSQLQTLSCRSNNLTSLDVSKNKLLRVLYCYTMPELCLSFLPNSLQQIYMDATTCLPNLPNNTFIVYDEQRNIIPKVVCDEMNNRNKCKIFPRVSGRVYVDVNSDNKYTQGVDYPYVNGLLKSGFTFNIDTNGFYQAFYDKLDTNYTITPVLGKNVISCTPQNYDFIFTIDSYKFTDKDFILSTASAVDSNQVIVSLTAITSSRRGFKARYKVVVKNNATEPRNVNVTLSFDSHLTFSQSLPEGTKTGNVISWDVQGLKPFAEKTFEVDFDLSADTPLGTVLQSVASTKVDIPNSEQFINTSILKQVTTGSYDPNDKSVDKGASVLPSVIENQEDFEYTIRFQNTGTDSAVNIVVKDSLLSNTFDISSLQIVSVSHPYHFTLKGNVASWVFNNILLPDSNVNKLGSNGFVKFKIKPLKTLADGDEIKNKASIYFDYNDPVITNTVITRVGDINAINDEVLEEDKIVVYPNPGKGVFYVQLNPIASLLQIYNATGQLLLEIPNAANNTVINLSGHQSGLYLLKVISKNAAQVKKLIIE